MTANPFLPADFAGIPALVTAEIAPTGRAPEPRRRRQRTEPQPDDTIPATAPASVDETGGA